MEILLLWGSFDFVINLFGVLVFVAMSWLYFDATVVRKQTNVWLSGLGALALAIGFAASIVDFVDIKNTIFGIGFGLIALGAWTKPMSKRPEQSLGATFVIPTGAVLWSSFIVVISSSLAGLGYFRLVSLGMERHLKRLGWGMYLLTISFLFGLRNVFAGWADSRLVNLVGEFQLFWFLEKIFLGFGLLLIGSWVFSYLLKRFETQLSLFLGGIVILVFGSSVVMYSFVIAFGYQEMMTNQSREVLKMTETYLKSKQSQMLSRAKLLAASEKQVGLIAGGDPEMAKKEVEEVAKSEWLNRIIVADAKMSPLLVWGGESSNFVTGNFTVDLQNKKHHSDLVLLNNEMYLVSGSTIESGGKTVGYVLLGKVIDSNFLTGVGFENAELLLWVLGELRAKTSNNNILRLGIKDVSGHFEKVKERREMTESGIWEISGKKYFGVSLPLFDTRGSVLGSLSSYHSSAVVWSEIDLRLKESYKIAMILLSVMVIPSYLMARKLRSQID